MSCTPRTAAASVCSPTRTRASSWLSGKSGLIPRSPLVSKPYFTVWPAAVQRAIAPPRKNSGSSGWARITRIVVPAAQSSNCSALISASSFGEESSGLLVQELQCPCSSLVAVLYFLFAGEPCWSFPGFDGIPAGSRADLRLGLCLLACFQNRDAVCCFQM